MMKMTIGFIKLAAIPLSLVGLAVLAEPALAEAKKYKHFNCPLVLKTYSYGKTVMQTNPDGSRTEWRIWIQEGSKTKIGRWSDGSAKQVWGHPGGKTRTELSCTARRTGRGLASAHVRIDGSWRCFFHRTYMTSNPAQLWCAPS